MHRDERILPSTCSLHYTNIRCDNLLPYPRLRVKVEAVYRDEKEATCARSGENLRLRLSGAEDTDVSPGFVLSSIKSGSGGRQHSLE